MKLSEAPDDRLVEEYIRLRDEKAQREARHKEELSPINKKMEKIEAEFLQRLGDRGAESVRTNAGTAYKSSRVSVTTADWDAYFHHFVLPNNAWEFIEHRPSKAAVQQYKAEHGDIPPGLNWKEEYVVGFRRS